MAGASSPNGSSDGAATQAISRGRGRAESGERRAESPNHARQSSRGTSEEQGELDAMCSEQVGCEGAKTRLAHRNQGPGIRKGDLGANLSRMRRDGRAPKRGGHSGNKVRYPGGDGLGLGGPRRCRTGVGVFAGLIGPWLKSGRRRPTLRFRGSRQHAVVRPLSGAAH